MAALRPIWIRTAAVKIVDSSITMMLKYLPPDSSLSGPAALHGLTRVRRFQQDDAHIFCRPDQVSPSRRLALSVGNHLQHQACAE